MDDLEVVITGMVFGVWEAAEGDAWDIHARAVDNALIIGGHHGEFALTEIFSAFY